ncbi:hypothetical protein [Indioceanicola profundi]|uniref:hypothetical protein n=1 Tax=Indioceanicola profundi TaxID=2220096 RepID=UPI000E6AB93B|nr:hypothetical protein [Indioceanicola profundi]
MILRVRRLPRAFDGFHAFACWPFIVIRTDVADEARIVLHEQVHYAEQRRCLLLPWLAMYFLSRRFRLKAEVRAYGVQVRAGVVSLEQAARSLTRYRTGISVDEAADILRRFLGR